jgi:DNA mismatch repair protein PMS2
VLNATQVARAQKETELSSPPTEEGSSTSNAKQPLFIPDDDDAAGAEEVEDIVTGEPNSEVASTDDSAGPPIEQEPENASPPAEEPRPPVVEKRPRSASPDPTSDEETRPLKKAATARSPSPAPTSSPAATTSASQRLAGPGRTPARVEQILSTNTNTSGTGRGMQMVLDTTGASWNLKPGHEGPQRKRSLLADANVSGSSSGKNARINMRARLAGFARDGVHLARDKEDADSPEEEEGAEDEVVEVRRSSKKVVDEDDDDDGCEVVDKPSPSTDVVDETMAVDRPDSEDEAPKAKPKSKLKARAPASKRADNAEPTSSEDLLLPDDSSAAPGNSAAATASSSQDAGTGNQAEVVRTVVGAAPPLAFDLERTTKTWTTYLERSAASTSAPQPAPRASELGHADLAADNDNATATLARVLSKADFGSMHVVGQFNRGFIVARLRKTDAENDDLFIVDQHAADEKYNFETLQTTTRLESQRLFTCVRFHSYFVSSVIVMTEQAARAGADGRGRARCSREYGRAAAKWIRGRGRGGPTGGAPAEARSAAREQKYRV